jgi:DNA-binding response OmpR family regulator
MHALIIEQDIWIRIMIEDVLRDLGYASFDSVTTLEAATSAADMRCPDLITSDVRLGTGTIIEAVRGICSAGPIPVVFITATPWEVRRIDRSAVIVPKPFGEDMLKEGVKRATASLSA